MAIQTNCPHCKKVFVLKDNQAGVKVRCKQCNQPFTVPGATVPAVAESERAGSPFGAFQTRPEPPAPRAQLVADVDHVSADDDDGLPPDELRSIANYQKGILYCLLAYFGLAFLLGVESRLIQVLVILPVVITATVFVFLLATRVYGTGVGITLGILTMIPGVGLIVLLIINGKATSVLKAHDIPVGLMGADMSAEAFRPRAESYRNTGSSPKRSEMSRTRDWRWLVGGGVALMFLVLGVGFTGLLIWHGFGPRKEPTARGVEELKAATVFVKVTTGSVRASGSGFLVKTDGEIGYIVTNEHVVHPGAHGNWTGPPPDITLVFWSGTKKEKSHPAEIMVVDPQMDLAILKVKKFENLPRPIDIATPPKLGETVPVTVYGFPFGEKLGVDAGNPAITVNRGSISSIRRNSKDEIVAIQIDGALNPGNSGGPVVDEDGHLVGVATATLRGAQAIGLAVPGSEVSELLQNGSKGIAVVNRPPETKPQGVRPPPDKQPKDPPPPPKKDPPLNPEPKDDPLPISGEPVSLPGPVSDVVVGGAGRFLIFHVPDKRQLVVFDAKEGKVVKNLPLPTDQVKIAAGLDKLIVILSREQQMQRWNLGTMEREKTVPFEMKVPVVAVALGSASAGPLLVEGCDWPRLGECAFFDVDTMKRIDYGFDAHGFFNTDPNVVVRASADGTCFTNVSHAGVQTCVVAGGKVQKYGCDADRYLVPGPDGRTLFAAGRLYSPEGKPIAPQAGRHGAMVWYAPAVHGPIYLSLNEVKDKPSGPSHLDLKIHGPGDSRALTTLPSLGALSGLVNWQTGQTEPIDRRVFLIPEFQRLIVLRAAKGQLFVHQCDLDEVLKKTEIDYLFVTSRPPASVKKGTTFDYAMTVKSKRGPFTCKLESGPRGMTVSDAGRISWVVPKSDVASEQTIIVSVKDRTGQECLHTFRLTVDGPVEATVVKPPDPKLDPSPKGAEEFVGTWTGPVAGLKALRMTWTIKRDKGAWTVKAVYKNDDGEVGSFHGEDVKWADGALTFKQVFDKAPTPVWKSGAIVTIQVKGDKLTYKWKNGDEWGEWALDREKK